MPFDYTPLYKSTFEKYVRGGFMDVISKRVPLLGWMRKSGCFAPWSGDGKFIYEEVFTTLYDSMLQALGPYEEINLQPMSGVELVPFHYKELIFPITITEREEKANTGRAQAINLAQSKMKLAQLSMAAAIESMLFGDGTLQGGKVMLGLEAIMPDNNATGSLGGFSRVTDLWLRHNSTTAAATAVPFDNLRAKMANITNSCTWGTQRPELYLTTQTVYEGYETLSFGKYAPTDKAGAADLGFGGDLLYRGKPVVFGDATIVGAGRMYALNSEALKFRVEGLKKSTDSPFTIEGPYNMRPHQKAKVWLISLNGAVTANMFRQLGKLYNIS
jgi:hypothetical protein